MGEWFNSGALGTKQQIFRKTNINYPLYKHLPVRIRTCAYQGVRSIRFLENLVCFAFVLPPFWDSSFYVITDELRKPDSYGKKAVSLRSLQKSYRQHFHPLPVLKVFGHKIFSFTGSRRLNIGLAQVRTDGKVSRFGIKWSVFWRFEEVLLSHDRIIARDVPLAMLFFRSKRLYSACIRGGACTSRICLYLLKKLVKENLSSCAVYAAN